MARTGHQVSVAQGAGWTTIFQASTNGGSDGRPVYAMEFDVTGNNCEISIDGIHEIPAGTDTYEVIVAGSGPQLRGTRNGAITKVRARGVSGASTVSWHPVVA